MVYRVLYPPYRIDRLERILGGLIVLWEVQNNKEKLNTKIQRRENNSKMLQRKN